MPNMPLLIIIIIIIIIILKIFARFATIFEIDQIAFQHALYNCYSNFWHASLVLIVLLFDYLLIP